MSDNQNLEGTTELNEEKAKELLKKRWNSSRLCPTNQIQSRNLKKFTKKEGTGKSGLLAGCRN